jgi:hypothetical protein
LKACLVAKGYTQTYGINSDETFSPVAKFKLSSVRVLISLIANLDWPLFQLDVKNVFLHKEVYMEQSSGFVTQGVSSRAGKTGSRVGVRSTLLTHQPVYDQTKPDRLV